MAKTVAQGFQELRANLEITDLQASTVSTCQQGVRDAVKKAFTLIEDCPDFLTGSYMRNTMIAPLNKADVDIFVILDDKYFRKNEQAYILDQLKVILKETYPTTLNISRDGQAVTIAFSEFNVDIVPAFKRTSFLGFNKGYVIPDTITKRWIATNPHKHIELWSKRNKAHQCNLVPLIKMIKGWNKENGDLFYSFHLECLILKVMELVTIRDFPSAVRYVFEKARKSFQDVNDPVMYSSVTGYLNTQAKIDAIAEQLELAYSRAKHAEEWVKEKHIEDAFYCWGKIFGSYFPGYEQFVKSEDEISYVFRFFPEQKSALEGGYMEEREGERKS